MTNVLKNTLLLTLLAPFAVACNNSDKGGLDSSRQVSSLSASEVSGLCDWAVDLQGGAGTTYNCGDDVTVTVEPVAECVAFFADLGSCALTVGQYEACSIALADNPCALDTACAPLFACL